MSAVKKINIDRLTTVQDIVDLMNRTGQARFKVPGDCLEGMNIPDGGEILVDFDHFPRAASTLTGQKDACLCFGRAPGDACLRVYVKQYIGVFGTLHTVGTQYKRKKGAPPWLNYAFFVNKIFGVVYAAYDKNGKLLWEKPIDAFPEKLSSAQTIFGNNVDPVFV